MSLGNSTGWQKIVRKLLVPSIIRPRERTSHLAKVFYRGGLSIESPIPRRRRKFQEPLWQKLKEHMLYTLLYQQFSYQFKNYFYRTLPFLVPKGFLFQLKLVFLYPPFHTSIKAFISSKPI
jgi:hypothetical protein